MRRWTILILVGLCGLLLVTALTGATYQWLATRKELAATPAPGHRNLFGVHGECGQMSGDYVRLRGELRCRYVENVNGDGTIEREAVAQIARDVEWLLDRRRAGQPLALRGIQTIHPVVVGADRAARTHGIWRYLDSELQQRLPADMPWTAAPLAVLGLEDLEWIEQAARDRHPRLQGVVPPVLQTLLWWRFDVRRYPPFWQLLGDALGEPQPNARLGHLFQQRQERMRRRFRRE